MPCPLPSTAFAPVLFILFAPVHFHVRQDRREELFVSTCLQAARLSRWQQQRGPPLQARVAAANGTVLAACKLLVQHDDPGAHGNEQGQTK